MRKKHDTKNRNWFIKWAILLGNSPYVSIYSFVFIAFMVSFFFFYYGLYNHGRELEPKTTRRGHKECRYSNNLWKIVWHKLTQNQYPKCIYVNRSFLPKFHQSYSSNPKERLPPHMRVHINTHGVKSI